MNNQNPYGAGGGYGGGPSGYGGGGGGATVPVPGVLDVGDVLSTTFRTIGATLVPVVACSLIIAVPTVITSFVVRMLMYLVMFSGDVPTMEDIQRGAMLGLITWIPSWIVLIVAHSIGQSGIMYAVAEHMSGRSATLGATLRVALSRLLWVVLTSLIVGIALVIGTVMCVVPAFIVAVFACVAVPVCVVERVGPIDSITRSIQLTEGNRVNILLVFLAVFVGLFVASCCIMSPAMGLMFTSGIGSAGDIQSIRDLQNPLAWQQLVSALSQIPLLLVSTAVQTTVVAVIYARLRGLRDGVDAQAIASVFS